MRSLLRAVRNGFEISSRSGTACREGEAPAEPRCPRDQRLGASLALPEKRDVISNPVLSRIELAERRTPPGFAWEKCARTGRLASCRDFLDGLRSHRAAELRRDGFVGRGEFFDSIRQPADQQHQHGDCRGCCREEPHSAPASQ